MPRRSKYAKQRHENTRIVPHSPKGLQVKSVKPRANDKCFCGSGLKQKKCHGTESQLKYYPTKAFEEAQKKAATMAEAAKYIHISLVETNKKDEFFTLMRSDLPGYTYFMDLAGRFVNAKVDSETTHWVQLEIAKTYMKPGESLGRRGMVLPNNTAVRRAFGLTLNDLKGRKKGKV